MSQVTNAAVVPARASRNPVVMVKVDYRIEHFPAFLPSRNQLKENVILVVALSRRVTATRLYESDFLEYGTDR
jgi:hypothetical protein